MNSQTCLFFFRNAIREFTAEKIDFAGVNCTHKTNKKTSNSTKFFVWFCFSIFDGIIVFKSRRRDGTFFEGHRLQRSLHVHCKLKRLFKCSRPWTFEGKFYHERSNYHSVVSINQFVGGANYSRKPLDLARFESEIWMIIIICWMRRRK